ncbi:hypothetical protein, partial [Pseudomonas sp. FEN]
DSAAARSHQYLADDVRLYLRPGSDIAIDRHRSARLQHRNQCWGFVLIALSARYPGI